MFRKTAILMIHGFTGSLYDHEILMNQLERNRKFHVFSWTLPGHANFFIKNATEEKYIEFVEEKIQYLLDSGFKKIYLVGHSMGGMLAGHLASKYKEVKKIVFVSAAYDYQSREQNFFDFFHPKELFDQDASYQRLFLKAIKVPIATRAEFKKTVRTTRRAIPKITIPALILHGTKDEVVPVSSARSIEKAIASEDKTITYVEEGRHVLLRGRKKQLVSDYIELFLKGGRKWKQVKRSKI